ncbi:DciA family protein [Nocardioides campestrisoli]|uniref:DciA family protein n=1 Tax=Nocardioides campestrisoli TaxID=2736757 RepID=UPI0015E65708|nr:DciA family protein [Nocardioides campestrisoli]
MPDSPQRPEEPEQGRHPEQGGTGQAGKPGPAEPGGLPDRPDEPRPEGLDLARAQARATSRLPGAAPARRKRPGSGSGSAFAPRSRGRSLSSGAYPDDRDPQLLGSALERLVRSRAWETDLQVQSVFARWAELVGGEIGDHSTPETLVDGKLVVRTDSTAWATQLRLLAPAVVRRLNGELGDGTVVLIEVLGPHLPSWKKGLRSTRGRGPRDTYG